MDKILEIPGVSRERCVDATLEALDMDEEKILAELQHRQYLRRMALAAQLPAQLAAAARARGVTKLIRGADGSGGQMDVMIPTESFHFWGQREGYDFWDDQQNLREFKRDNPAARVQVQNDRLTIVKPEFSAPARGPVRGKRGRWAL